MVDLPDVLNFEKDRSADPDRMNRAMAYLLGRIAALDAFRPNWQAEVDNLVGVGLSRINDALLPAFQNIQSVADFGFLTAQVDGSISFEDGIGLVTLASGPQRDNFQPTPFVVFTRSENVTDWAIARVDSYERASGALSFTIEANGGEVGPFSDVTVGAAAAGAIVAQQAIDAADAAAESSVDAEAAAVTATTKASDATAALMSLQGLYRGASATPPTSPAAGHMWFDTVAHAMKVYDADSSQWGQVSGTALGGVRHIDFSTTLGNATDGQTAFAVTGGFTHIDLSIDGVQLVQGVGFTASTPNVTLTSGLVAGKVLQARGYLALLTSDIYSKAEVNSALALKADATTVSALSSSTTSALALKAPLASPALTGTPTAPNAALGTNSTQIANTAFVQAAVAALVASAPGALDTLDELAAALGDDSNFATTIAGALGNRVRVDAAQGLSGPQQSQARANIGAMVDGNVDVMTRLASGAGTNFGYLLLDLGAHIAAGRRKFRLKIHNYRTVVDNFNMVMSVSANGGGSFPGNIYKYTSIFIGNEFADAISTTTGTESAAFILTGISNGSGNESSGWIDFECGTGHFDFTSQMFAYYAAGYGAGMQMSAGKIGLANVNYLRFETYTGNIASAAWTLYGAA